MIRYLCVYVIHTIFLFSSRSTANAIQNYSFEAKTDDLPSLADKMSLLDIGAPNNVAIPVQRNNGSTAPMVTKIPIERVDKGKQEPDMIYVYYLYTYIA